MGSNEKVMLNRLGRILLYTPIVCYSILGYARRQLQTQRLLIVEEITESSLQYPGFLIQSVNTINHKLPVKLITNCPGYTGAREVRTIRLTKTLYACL